MQDVKLEALEERIMETPSLAPAILEERFLNIEYVFVLFNSIERSSQVLFSSRVRESQARWERHEGQLDFLEVHSKR